MALCRYLYEAGNQRFTRLDNFVRLLSTFCLTLWTIKWSKVRGGREREGAKAFSCTSNVLQSLPLYFTGKKEEVTINFLPQSRNWSCCPLHEPRQSWERTDVITPLEEGEALPQWELPHTGTGSQLLPRSQADGFQNEQSPRPSWWYLAGIPLTISRLAPTGRGLSHLHSLGLGWIWKYSNL